MPDSERIFPGWGPESGVAEDFLGLMGLSPPEMVPKGRRNGMKPRIPANTHRLRNAKV